MGVSYLPPCRPTISNSAITAIGLGVSENSILRNPMAITDATVTVHAPTVGIHTS
ncbi:MAG: hypothetical protein OXN27_16875 [Candidatus Poribacteria bacterium]|nr:hypothetical protein [Candidatus Poribacteria bacterium]